MPSIVKLFVVKEDTVNFETFIDVAFKLPEILTFPITSKASLGELVPIPTLPDVPSANKTELLTVKFWLIFAFPATTSFCPGLSVPIPTLPAMSLWNIFTPEAFQSAMEALLLEILDKLKSLVLI